MADWSELPTDLLTLITKRLETRFAVLRFRSVCSSWRSFLPPKVYPLPKYLPSKAEGRCEYSLSHITRNTYYLIRLPGIHHNRTSDPGCCWLVKIRDGTDRVGMRLLNPLSDSELKPFPVRVFDLTSFQVIELGHEFVGRYDVYIEHPLEPQSRDYRKKVTLMWFDNADFMMLSLFRSFVDYLAFLRSGEKEWTLLENVHNVEDTISFNGKFYAIEQNGRTIVVDQSLDVNFLKLVGSPNSRKFLVQSGDHLLAVEMIFLERSDSVGNKVAGFRIFRLDKEEKKWDEMESLGDQILFLGLRQAISVSASEFTWGRGNLIFYSTGYCQDGDRAIFVFDLENGSANPLENCPPYFSLFWPPPEWVTSTLPKVECKTSHSVISSAESVISSIETMSNSSYTLISSAADAQNQYPGSNSTVSTKKVGGRCPERIPSAGKEISSKRHSPSSKFSFKFCCS